LWLKEKQSQISQQAIARLYLVRRRNTPLNQVWRQLLKMVALCQGIAIKQSSLERVNSQWRLVMVWVMVYVRMKRAENHCDGCSKFCKRGFQRKTRLNRLIRF